MKTREECLRDAAALYRMYARATRNQRLRATWLRMAANEDRQADVARAERLGTAVTVWRNVYAAN